MILAAVLQETLLAERHVSARVFSGTYCDASFQGPDLRY